MCWIASAPAVAAVLQICTSAVWRPLMSADVERSRHCHMVNECPNTMLPGAVLQRLHCANNDAVNWLKQTSVEALVK